ncbi:radical SAM protein [Magnetospirillum sp. 64-120]|uniref:B12-binding domain-containing radical SAM protein n=1 Tax=Magnetospirillum sp. 64-120 TaxID=1895778 RepID=UPI000926091D|nr:radical SAM protein [Magnetospirillum sp. 64-120]OJX70339.1 MAG: hypothetical protein BGO92_17260 [Magnetospirillum sp. 64-120]
MKPKILLAQTPFWNINNPPYTLALLAGTLRARGFDVIVRDYEIEFFHFVRPKDRELWEQESSQKWFDDGYVRDFVTTNYADFVEWCVNDIVTSGADFVGFSVKVGSRAFSLILAERLKQVSPSTFVAFGGPEMYQGVRRYLQAYSFIDAVCWQEADASFPAFMERYERNPADPGPEPGWAYRRASDGEIVDGLPIAAGPSLDHIAFADYSDFDFDRYRQPHSMAMILSRGCINRCTFCSEAPAYLKYRYYPGQRIYDEVSRYVSQSNVHRPARIFFNDSLLNGRLESLDEFSDLLLANPIPGGLKWGGMMLVRKRMTDAMIEKFAKAGLDNILLGMESGSEKVIKAMKKNFVIADAERIIRKAHACGIAVTVSIIFGHPGEGEAEFHETIRFLARNQEYVSQFLLNTLNLHAESYIGQNLANFGIVPPTETMEWVADDGANTSEIRASRQAVARALLGTKAIDYGQFKPQYALPRSDDRPPIRVTQTVDFTNLAPASAVIGRGWGMGEDWGTWTNAAEAHLDIRLYRTPFTDLVLELDARADVHAQSPDMAVKVSVNGQTVGVLTYGVNDDTDDDGFAMRQVHLPLDLIKSSNRIAISLNLEGDTPLRQGRGPAKLGVRSLRLQPPVALAS